MSKQKTIVLLSCVATKLPKPAPARELYNSPLFKRSLSYALTLDPDDIVILSAKYYVIPLDKIIAPYDKTLLNMPKDEANEWGVKVLSILADKYNLEEDKFIILAGEKYRKYITPQMNHWVAPLKGLRIGQQLAWYVKKLAKNVKEGFIKLLNLLK
jgi:hypothetical protein